MLDNITVNDRGQIVMQEDVGNQEYLGGVWLYDIASGDLNKIAEHDPERFTTGASGFLTKDEESSGVIPAPFLGESWHLIDVQAHYPISGELVQGGQTARPAHPAGEEVQLAGKEAAGRAKRPARAPFLAMIGFGAKVLSYR
jgi:hypothetical protein